MPVIGLATAQLSASHTASCGDGRHGHAWNVRVETAGTQTQRQLLVDILVTLHLRDLDAFLPGVDTSPAGFAAYLHERLADTYITAIEVSTMDGQGARVEWPKR